MRPGYILSLVVILLLISLFGSCVADQQNAELPAYITVHGVSFLTEPDQGTERQLISEIWIYADSQFIGTYPSISEFPILADGPLTLDIFPGIRENGQALAPVIYPMMSPFQVTVAAQPGTTTMINPAFRYAENIVIAINENFETTNIFTLDLDGDTLTNFRRSTEQAIDGSSATATLTEAHSLLEVASKFGFGNIADRSLPTFLEMEYSSETPLAVGIRMAGSTNVVYKLILFANPSGSQKIYVNFTDEIQSLGPGTYEILFRSNFNPDLPKPMQVVTIDNIKLLHFRP
ncbi:MAG: hypothetical protein HKN76_17665 [Saprospiraceae bacterium]|nr:hypothetical protein [Saprospiraceae bacterium]